MKKILTLSFAICILISSCKPKETKSAPETDDKVTYVTFGDQIATDGAISQNDMYKKYESMTVSDTVDVKFTTTVTKVCQKKGCWITVPLADGKESFVKFKDYGFFLPMNAGGNEVVLNGKAFKSVTSIEELKHYAEDAGKSAEEIAKITEPKATYSFLADGVLLASNTLDE